MKNERCLIVFLKTILLAQAKTLPVGLGSTTVAANDLTGLSDLLASTNHVLQVTLLYLFKSICQLFKIQNNHHLRLVCLSTEKVHIHLLALPVILLVCL